MTSISTTAAARREAARQDTGEFGEHIHSNPELALGQATWPDDLGKTHHTHQWGEVNVEYGARTPWGPAQHASREADGIVFVPTDGHGGYKLSKERNAAIPRPYRNASGWYEEDGDRVFVELYHYDALFHRPQDADRDRDQTLQTFDQKIRDYYPAAWEKVNGRELEPGESDAKDKGFWIEQNADEYVATFAKTIEDGLVLVGARRQSTGDEDQFLMTRAQYDKARADAADELGSDGRFRIPEGLTPEPRPEPKPAKPGYTTVPSTDGLSAAAAKKVREELDTRWRLRDSGAVLTLRQQIEQGHITTKRVHISEGGTRQFYLENENTGSNLKVSKALFEAFEAPDTRTAKDRAREEYQLAVAKRDKAQRAVDGQWRPTSEQYRVLREASAAADASYARYQAVDA